MKEFTQEMESFFCEVQGVGRLYRSWHRAILFRRAKLFYPKNSLVCRLIDCKEEVFGNIKEKNGCTVKVNALFYAGGFGCRK